MGEIQNSLHVAFLCLSGLQIAMGKKWNVLRAFLWNCSVKENTHYTTTLRLHWNMKIPFEHNVKYVCEYHVANYLFDVGKREKNIKKKMFR